MKKKNIRTFSVCPENFTGEKGGGAKATLDNGTADEKLDELMKVIDRLA